MLTSKHFKTETELLEWANAHQFEIEHYINIVKDHTNGDFILFYLSA